MTTILIALELPLVPWLYKLLVDQDFRKASCARLGLTLDAELESLIVDTVESFNRLGQKEQMHAANSTLNRLHALSYSRYTRWSLGSPDLAIALGQWMQQGRHIILNTGTVPDGETRKLINALFLVQLEQAALARSNLPISQRTPFTIFCDEWQSYGAQLDSINTVLSQTRKFAVNIWLASQSPASIESARLTGAMENCKNLVLFSLGYESAQRMAYHIAQVDPCLHQTPSLGFVGANRRAATGGNTMRGLLVGRYPLN